MKKIGIPDVQLLPIRINALYYMNNYDESFDELVEMLTYYDVLWEDDPSAYFRTFVHMIAFDADKIEGGISLKEYKKYLLMIYQGEIKKALIGIHKTSENPLKYFILSYYALMINDIPYHLKNFEILKNEYENFCPSLMLLKSLNRNRYQTKNQLLCEDFDAFALYRFQFYFKTCQYKEALKENPTIGKSNSENYQKLLSYAYFHEAKTYNNVDTLHAYLDSAVSVNYFNKVAWMYKGALLLKDQQFSQARVFFIALIEQNPENINALINLGISNFYLNRFDDATGNFRNVITLVDQRPVPYYYLGLIALKLGDLEEAIELLKKSSDLGYNEAFELWNDLVKDQ